jgi:ribosomal protein S18 acetylase RimI-like enzyme
MIRAAVTIRPATETDVDAIAALMSARRRVYEQFEPRFWRVAENADAVHRPWLEFLVADDSVVSLVAEIDGAFAGFVIATVGPAPPVYDPGGLAAMIDDYAVVGDTWDTIGRALLDAVTERVRERGAAQVIVVCGHRDEAKRSALQQAGLSLASEWYTGPTEGE